MAAAAPVVVDCFPFASLPPALALTIFAALPADARLRCAEVCRGWRAMLTERSLWTRLDLSDSSGVTHRVTPALLRAAATKAGGALQALDVSGVWHLLLTTRGEPLRNLLAANAGALRELRCLRGREPFYMPLRDLEALLPAAPQLRVCEGDVLSGCIDKTRRALRNEGVFGPLRMRSVMLTNLEEEATFVSLLADVAAHASLAELRLSNLRLHLPDALDAFVNAALLSLPLLRTATLESCRLSPASAPALARLLGSGTLTELSIIRNNRTLLDEPAAVLLSDTLRANATLTALTLTGAWLWSNDAAAAALLGALTGHVSLRQLCIAAEFLPHACRPEEDRLYTGAALLGTLVAADAPALTALHLLRSSYGATDAVLRPLFKALPANTHLQELRVSFARISDVFAAEVLLPAVRANTSPAQTAADGLFAAGRRARGGGARGQPRRSSAAGVMPVMCSTRRVVDD
jgi:hypothetical protein